MFESRALADRECGHVNRVPEERQTTTVSAPKVEPLKIVADRGFYEADMARRLVRADLRQEDIVDALALEYASNQGLGGPVEFWQQRCLKAAIEMIVGREVEMEVAA